MYVQYFQLIWQNTSQYTITTICYRQVASVIANNEEPWAKMKRKYHPQWIVSISIKLSFFLGGKELNEAIKGATQIIFMTIKMFRRGGNNDSCWKLMEIKHIHIKILNERNFGPFYVEKKQKFVIRHHQYEVEFIQANSKSRFFFIADENCKINFGKKCEWMKKVTWILMAMINPSFWISWKSTVKFIEIFEYLIHDYSWI